MGRRDVGCLMAGRLQQGHVHLQRGVGQQPGDLGLGGDLGGHQVQDQDLQRADMLGQRPLPVHDKDIFLVQGIVGGQVLGMISGIDSTPLDGDDSLQCLRGRGHLQGFIIFDHVVAPGGERFTG